MSRMRRRAAAELTLACAPLEDQLLQAKAAHEQEPTAQTRAAMVQSMATVHETRAWLRAADELERLPGEIAAAQQQLDIARKARNPQTAKQVPTLEAKVRRAQEKLARIQWDFGPLVTAMEELAAAGGGS
jgi:hypothetical protein